MASSTSGGTRGKLLGLVDDMELIAKEMMENLMTAKGAKGNADALTQLLVAKNDELKSTLSVASEQASLQQVLDSLHEEVYRHDQDIYVLQFHLREAGHLLATAVYQAKQKLQSIQNAEQHSVNSEELIKYAHRISASNAVAAPHNWQQGDPRRPYPTDLEMRQGFLGRLGEMPIGTALQASLQTPPPHLSSQPDHHLMTRMALPLMNEGPSMSGQFPWSGAADMKPQFPAMSGADPQQQQNNEDVEVMSTDSSSSSSSDSQ